jgi:hypothetical protein
MTRKINKLIVNKSSHRLLGSSNKEKRNAAKKFFKGYLVNVE